MMEKPGEAPTDTLACNQVDAGTVREVSVDELKYPPLCLKCVDMIYEGYYCGVMMEAIMSGSGIWSCPYYKKQDNPEEKRCDSCGKLVCRLKNARIQGCRDHIPMDIAARAHRDEPANERHIRGFC
jgi:hypothetical protein